MTYRIGVDGGGTKTACLLVDAAGAVAARHLAPGCNPSLEGAAGARRILGHAIAALRAQVPGAAVAGTLLCMAGAPEFWRETAGGLTGLGPVVAVPDSLPVLEAATRGHAGLVLHAGTGSFVAARTAAETKPSDLLAGAHYAGGLGWRFGDPGSGYDIGRRAIARALLELQGWAEPSQLGPLLLAHTGLSGADAITRHLYRESAPATEITGFAPAVLQAAAAGDPAARQAVLDSAGELVELGRAVAARLFPGAPDGGIRAGLSGKILNYPFVLAALAPRAPFPLFPVADSPEEGLRLLLARWRPD
jgi:glucosamine kinase